jgi:hypothetical protein
MAPNPSDARWNTNPPYSGRVLTFLLLAALGTFSHFRVGLLSTIIWLTERD